MSTTAIAQPTISAAALRHATLAVPAPRPATVQVRLPSGESHTLPIDSVERVGTGPDAQLVIYTTLQERNHA
jgi:hypothetical protein